LQICQRVIPQGEQRIETSVADPQPLEFARIAIPPENRAAALELEERYAGQLQIQSARFARLTSSIAFSARGLVPVQASSRGSPTDAPSGGVPRRQPADLSPFLRKSFAIAEDWGDNGAHRRARVTYTARSNLGKQPLKTPVRTAC
jgi:hypothetical protein